MLMKNIWKQSKLFTNLYAKFNFSTPKVIYLDYQATTPIDYRVVDAMQPYMLQYYGNPHSRTHQYGWDSSKGIEVAR